MNNLTSDLLLKNKIIKQIEGIADYFSPDLCTDSRRFEGQATFVALKGKNFDASDFVVNLFKQGCRCFVLDSEQFLKIRSEIDLKKVGCLLVEDTTKFLQEYAHYVRLILKSKVICISGSNGKTTTKEMIYVILNKFFPGQVIKTLANNNNHLGVPLSLLQANEQTRFSIIELGSNHPGEMNLIASIAKPDCAIVTNIGETHMEFFPTLEDVFFEESAVFNHVNSNGLIILNSEDDYLKNISPVKKNIKVVTYSVSQESNYVFSFEDNRAYLKHNESLHDVTNLHIWGSHNFWNLMVAIVCVSEMTDFSLNDIVKAASDFRPTMNRSEIIIRNKVKIYLDAYNANPSSMLNALEAFYVRCQNEKNLIIIGDMNELGDHTEDGHRKVGKLLKSYQAVDIVFIGRYAQYVAKEVSQLRVYGTAKEYADFFKKEYLAYQNVFIKGSRSLQLESLLDIT